MSAATSHPSGPAPRVFTRADVRAGYKPVDAWWTVLVIDPISERILPRLLRYDAITPNRLTVLAGVLGTLSGLCFLAGLPILAGILFEVRFLADCLDGKVARLKGNGSPLGAFLDKIVDIVVGTWAYVCAGYWLTTQDVLADQFAMLAAVSVLVWNWSNSHLQPGGPGPAKSAGSGGGLSASFRRRRLTRLPGSVEATTLALFLAPLTGSPRVMVTAMWIVILGFYLPAFLMNAVKGARAAQRPAAAGPAAAGPAATGVAATKAAEATKSSGPVAAGPVDPPTEVLPVQPLPFADDASDASTAEFPLHEVPPAEPAPGKPPHAADLAPDQSHHSVPSESPPRGWSQGDVLGGGGPASE